MTKIRQRGNSSMIEDRRGQGGSSGGGGMGFPFPTGGGGGGGAGFPFPMKMGGGMIGILVLLAVMVLPKLLKAGGSVPRVPSGNTPVEVNSPNLGPDDGTTSIETDAGAASGSGGACDTEIAQIVCGGVVDVQTFWIEEFKKAGKEYEITPTVFFSGATNTGCGQGTAQTGPFYCPLDSKVYFDLDFLIELQNRFDAKGDLAAQYIVAHEYGHHLQNILGISSQVRQAQQANPSQANALSVRLELQADCLAGVWARNASDRGQFGEGELQEALDAAAAVGDDRIQEKTSGRVDEESWTHGSSEQRMQWFKRGFQSGSSNSCDTFSE